MAVLSKISIGNIFYYVVDDIPNHTAPKGSIALITSGSSSYVNSMTYINNDGASTWLKSIPRGYAEINITNNTTSIDPDGTQTLGSWYAFESVNSWTADKVGEDFQFRTADDIIYTGDTLIRAIVSQTATLRAGPSKWVSWSIGPSLNFTVPSRYNTGFGLTNAGTISIRAIRDTRMNTGDYVLGAVSPQSREAGGGSTARVYIPKHSQLSVFTVDAALKKILVNEGFESGNFTEGGWTTVNDTTNVWVVGTAENNGGTYSAYVSNNGGTSASYTITTANASHFYKDFTFATGADEIFLLFDWKCQGENAAAATQYDYGTIVMTTTGTTPVAGAEVSTAQAASGGNGRIGAVANLGKFNLNYGTTPGTVWNTESINLTPYAGQTKRIVFTWKNDNIAGAQPPMIIDNIRIVEYKW